MKNSAHILTAVSAEISRPKSWRKFKQKTGWKTSLENWHPIEDNHGRQLDDNIFSRLQREKQQLYSLTINSIFYIMEQIRLTQDNAKALRQVTGETIKSNVIAILGNEYLNEIEAVNWSAMIVGCKGAEAIDEAIIEKMPSNLAKALNDKTAKHRKENKARENAQKYVDEAKDQMRKAQLQGTGVSLADAEKVATASGLSIDIVISYAMVAKVQGLTLGEAVNKFSKVEK